MRLLPIPDDSGNPQLWINVDHLVSVQAQYRTTVEGVMLAVEVKVDGMPLQKVNVGEYRSRQAAETAFMAFLDTIQTQEPGE